MSATHDRLNVALPSDDAALGPNDRLRLYIPTKVTTLSMGWRLPTVAYHGAGLNTLGHIILDAASETSTVTVQAQSGILMQSVTADVNVSAKTTATLGADGSVYVAGDGGVFVAAGHGGPGPTTQVPGDSGEPEPWQIAGLQDAVGTVNTIWVAIDTALAGLVMVRTLAEMGKSIYHKSAAAPDVGVGLLGVGIAATAIAATAASEGFGKGFMPGGLSLYGKGGVLMASPWLTSVYGGAGLVLGSAFPLVFAAVDGEFLAVRNATMSGFYNATLQSYFGGTKVSSGTKVEVTAPSVTVGGPTDVPPTLDVTVAATVNVTLQVGTYKVEVTPAGITITNGSTLSAKVGPATLHLRCGNNNVVVGPDDIKLVVPGHTLRGAPDGWQIG